MVTKAVQEPKNIKQVAKAHWACMACGSDFWGAKKSPKCPKCGAEGFDLKELNADGIPIQDVKNALSGGVDVTHEGGNTIIESNKPHINLDYSRAAIGRADDIAAEMFEREMTSAIQSDVSNKVKAKAAMSKAELLEQELKLKDMERSEGDETGPQNPFSMNSVSASSLIQSISGLPEEEREWWLGQIKDPQAVYGLATLLNPPKQTMQGGIPFQQQNPLMNLMGVRQQMEQMQPQQQAPQQQQGESEGETSTMLDMAQAMKIMHEIAMSSIPPPVDPSESNKDLKEALREIKDSQEKLNDRYYALRVEQLEGGGGGITEERLEAIIATRLAATNKSPLESLKELKSTLTEIDGLRELIEPKTDIIHGEPIDEWIKKHTLEREMQEDKLKHEEHIAAQNAKTAKWAVAKNLLSDGIKANIAARTRDGDEEKEEEKVPDVLRRSKVTLVK